MNRARKTRQIVSLFAAILLVYGSSASADGTAPEEVAGLWLTEKGKVAVELMPCGAELCGRIAWLAKPYTKKGALKRDLENPDPALRERPWCGITVITGLRTKKPGKWTDGIFYFPKDGRRYDLEIKRSGETLTVHAFLGLKFLGKKETWRRAPETLGGCVEAS